MTHDDALPARFTLAEVAAFLDGSGTLDGVAFGERHPTEPGAYWWRKHLRAALAARAVPVAVVLKGALDTLAEYGCSDTRLYKPGDAPDQEWGVPLYAAPPALPPGAREAIEFLLAGLDDFRDAVLNGRGALAECGTYEVNDVLSEFDEATSDPVDALRPWLRDGSEAKPPGRFVQVGPVMFGDSEKGRLLYCHITQRTGRTEPMFYQRTDGTIVANLVGYRIEPLSDEERRALGDTKAGEGG